MNSPVYHSLGIIIFLTTVKHSLKLLWVGTGSFTLAEKEIKNLPFWIKASSIFKYVLRSSYFIPLKERGRVMKPLYGLILVVVALNASAAGPSTQLLTPIAAGKSNEVHEKVGQLVDREMATATRWRFVHINTPLLLAAGVESGELKALPPRTKIGSTTVDISELQLNLFDDVRVNFEEIVDGRNSSMKTLSWKCGQDDPAPATTVYTTTYELRVAEIPTSERIIGLNYINLRIVNGRGVNLEVTRPDGKRYRLHPVRKELEFQTPISRRVPHIVLEFDPNLPGTKRLFTWDEADLEANELPKQERKRWEDIMAQIEAEYQNKYKGCELVTPAEARPSVTERNNTKGDIKTTN